MNEIPTWWLILSGVFFVVNAVFFVALTYAVLQLMKFQKALEPKVHDIATKVDSIAGKVDDISEHVRHTVTNVGGHAESISSSADVVGRTISNQMSRYAPIVTGAMTLFKVFQFIQGMRATKARKEASKVDKPRSKKT